MEQQSDFIGFLQDMREWEYCDNILLVGLYIKLVIMANTQDYVCDGEIAVKRGQVVTTMKVLSEVVDMKQEILRVRLKKLVITNKITIKSTNKYSIITICNYDSYASEKSSKLRTKLRTKLQTNPKSAENTPILQPNYEQNYKQNSVVNDCNSDSCECNDNEELRTKLQTNCKTENFENSLSNIYNLNNNINIKKNIPILPSKDNNIGYQKKGSARTAAAGEVESEAPVEKVKLQKKKESAETLNTRLLNEAVMKKNELGNELSAYYRFILYVNENYPTLLHFLRLMSEQSFTNIRTRWTFEQIDDMLKELDNKIEFIKKKGYTELGLVLQNWLKPKY